MILRALKHISKLKPVITSISVNLSRKAHSLIATELTNKCRSLISVKGADAKVYLQGLITNDVHLLRDDNRLMYSMVLNNRGRLMFDTLIYYLPHVNNLQDDQRFLLEVDSSKKEELLKYLKIYRVRRKVELEDAKDEFKLFVVNNQNNESANTPFSLDDKVDKNDLVFQESDPRYKPFGLRALFKNSANFNAKDVFKQIETTSDLNAYKKHLCKYGIAENSDMIPYGNAIPLEYNIVFMNGVSFNKGCYLGQELVAKTHYTGVIRKRIMPFKLIGENDLMPYLICRRVESDVKTDSSILNTKTGQSVGKLRYLIDNCGIAMIRLSQIDNSNLALVDANGKQYKIEVSIPKYWQLDEALANELKNAHIS